MLIIAPWVGLETWGGSTPGAGQGIGKGCAKRQKTEDFTVSYFNIIRRRQQTKQFVIELGINEILCVST
jgi:hypothetical protein